MNTDRYAGWIIFGLMVFVTAVGVLFSIHLSLRLDESQSLWQTSHDVPTMLNIIAQDVHVPLYHLMVHFWQVFFGNNVAGVRLISLAFFAATIPAVYFLGKESYGQKVAVFASILVAVSPFLNWYGSEARMYSLLVFITVLNQYFFIRLFKSNSGIIWLGYFITALFGMYTHYFFFFSLITQAVFFYSHRSLFGPKATRNFHLIAALLAILFLPWVYLVVHLGLASTTQPQLSPPSTFNIFDSLTQFIFGFQADNLDTILVALWPVSVLLAIFALRRDRRSGERRKVPPYTLYFLMSALFPIILAFVISFYKPLYLTRYLILTIPSLYLFLSWMIATFPRDLARFTRVLLVVVMLLTFVNQSVSAATPVKENYQGAVSYLSQHATDQDVIILSAPFTVYPVEYYYKGPASIETMPPWNRFAHGALPAFSAAQLPAQAAQVDDDHQTAWLLLSYDQGYNDKIQQYYDSHFQRIDQQTFSPGLTLYAYKLKYP